jgi:hypothetical protein
VYVSLHHASDDPASRLVSSLDLGGGCDATPNGRSSTRHRVARERPFGVVAVAIVTREKKSPRRDRVERRRRRRGTG